MRPGNFSKDGQLKTTLSPIQIQTESNTEWNTTGPGLIVIIGGRTYNGTYVYHNDVQIYTVDKGHVTWYKYGRPAPYRWYAGGTAVSGSNIYIAGGRIGHGSNLQHAIAAKYTARFDHWEILPNITRAGRSTDRLPMYVINNKLYAVQVEDTTPYIRQLDLSDVNSRWKGGQVSPRNYVFGTQAVATGNTAYLWTRRPNFYDKVVKNVISWTYRESIKWTRLADMNIHRYIRHGKVTDGISNIWVVGGCGPDECWPDGFIEHYNVTDNTWTKLKQVPNVKKDIYYVQVCFFWQGYIYVIFSKDYRTGIISRFHIFNTQTGSWHVDNIELKLLVSDSMYGIVPKHPEDQQTTNETVSDLVRNEDVSQDEAYETTLSPVRMQTESGFEWNTTGPGLIVIMGGRTYKTNEKYTRFHDEVQIYSVDNGQVAWKRNGKPLPFPWASAGAVASAGNIYIAGGWALGDDWRVNQKRSAKFHVKNNTWEILPHKKYHAESGPAMYVLENKLYATHGSTTYGVPDWALKTEKLNLSNVDSGWEEEDIIPIHSVTHSDAVVVETQYIFVHRVVRGL